MGLYEAVRDAGTDMQGGSFVDGGGQVLATMDGATIGFRSGDDLEILRGRLARLFYERTCDDVEYLFGDSIAAMAEAGDGVEVNFERGPARRFDLVIGADGLHSRVRSLAFGEEATFARELGSYIAIFSVPNRWQLDRWEMIHRRPGRIVNVYSTRGDREAKVCVLFAAPPLVYDRHDVARQKHLVAQFFAGVGWDVPWMLEAMADARDFYFDSMTQVVLDRWSAGRIALVGDAGYCPSPSSGQGTSLALVGAYVLAAELAAAPCDHAAAFARYEARMRGFVEVNQAFGSEVARGLVTSGAFTVWWQTQAMRLVSRLPWKNLAMRPIIERIRKLATAVTLETETETPAPMAPPLLRAAQR
jgi:2-polyprenyl-6-methoxyphenol hydroxylase-like FAD-dependent oxidoreductase